MVPITIPADGDFPQLDIAAEGDGLFALMDDVECIYVTRRQLEALGRAIAATLQPAAVPAATATGPSLEDRIAALERAANGDPA
jgi:hypothetical protein